MLSPETRRRSTIDFGHKGENERQTIQELLALGGRRDERGNITLGGYVVHGPDLGGVDLEPRTGIDTEPRDFYETEEQVRSRKSKSQAA